MRANRARGEKTLDTQETLCDVVMEYYQGIETGVVYWGWDTQVIEVEVEDQEQPVVSEQMSLGWWVHLFDREPVFLGDQNDVAADRLREYAINDVKPTS